jgi:hypothetical protein
MRRKAEKWTEVGRQRVGFTTGFGRGKTMPWFSLVYRVIETRKERGKLVESRERMVYGKSINMMTAPELAFGRLLAIVADGADVLCRYAEAEDDKARKKAKRGD